MGMRLLLYRRGGGACAVGGWVRPWLGGAGDSVAGWQSCEAGPETTKKRRIVLGD